MGCIYKLDFPNGKSYIGMTSGKPERRFNGHKRCAAKGVKRPLYDAWNKFGCPVMSVLAVVDDCELADAEIRAIKAFGTMLPSGYNLTEGGEVSPMLTPSVAKRIGESKIGVKLSKDHKKAIGDAHRGMKRSEETKAKIAASAKARGISEETRRKMNEAKRGKVMSEEQKAKISASLRARSAISAA